MGVEAMMWPEVPALYDVARRVCHDSGLPWTDPRTGVTYPPPQKVKRKKTQRRRKAR